MADDFEPLPDVSRPKEQAMLYLDDVEAPKLPENPANSRPDPVVKGRIIIDPTGNGEGLAIVEQWKEDPEFQKKLQRDFGRRGREKLTEYDGVGVEGYGERAFRAHVLPAEADVRHFISTADSFLKETQKAGKIATAQIQTLLDLIAEGAELNKRSFVKHTIGEYDTDAMFRLTSLHEQYAACDKELNGTKLKANNAALCAKLFRKSHTQMAQQFFDFMLNQFEGGKFPTGVYVQHEIDRAYNQAYEALCIVAGVNLPKIESENDVRRPGAPAKAPAKKAPIKQVQVKEAEPEVEEGDDTPVKQDPNQPPKKFPPRDYKKEAAEDGAAFASEYYQADYNQAIADRQKLFASRAQLTAMFGPLLPTAEAADKGRAVEAVAKTVMEAIKLMQLTESTKPNFDGKEIGEQYRKIHETTKAYALLPKAVWKLVEPIRNNKMLLEKLPADAQPIVNSIITLNSPAIIRHI